MTDTRWMRFPEDTYGLGATTTLSDAEHIDFKYLRTYFTFYKKISPDFYGGIGYDLDYHYGINRIGKADSSATSYSNYGFRPTAISSGFNLSLLFLLVSVGALWLISVGILGLWWMIMFSLNRLNTKLRSLLHQLD